MAIDDLYDRDFYVWTQKQAAALRAAANAGGRSSAVEWERLAEEVEDLGKSEFREAASHVSLIMEHMLKLEWSRRDEPRGGWRAEIIRFRANLERVLTPTLRAKVEAELEKLHVTAAKAAAASFEPDAPRDETLRWTLDVVLGDRAGG